MVNYERLVLANGLRVLLHHSEDTPLVAVNLLFNAGSKFDPIDKSGLAHLFEHLMFAGTAAVPDFDEPVQIAGAENNAFTNSDYANYYSYGPYQNLETLLWLEADRLANLNVTRKAFETQRKVVIEELHESCLNVPYGDVWHRLLPLIYRNHPYKWPTIGLTEKEISSIRLSDVKSFYKRHYSVNSCILSIAGNFDAEETKRWIEKYYGDILPSPLQPEPNSEFDFRDYHPQKVVVKSDVPVPAFFLAFPMPGRTSPDYYVLDLLSDLMSVGRSSIFYKTLIKGSEVLSAGDAFITGTHDTGLFIIEGKMSEGVSYSKAYGEIMNMIADIRSKAVDLKTMEKLKNGLESSVVFSEVSTMSKAMNLGYFELLGDVDLINSEPAKYQDITAEDLMRVTKKYLDESLVTSVIYYPQLAS